MRTENVDQKVKVNLRNVKVFFGISSVFLLLLQKYFILNQIVNKSR